MSADKYNPNQIMESFSLNKLSEIIGKELVAAEKKMIADKYEEDNNYDLAFQWYRLASTFGDVDSLFKIGTYYEYGYSVEKNVFRAYVYYERAAEQGNTECLRRLASEFYSGSEYCPQNTEIAKRYWIRLFINNPASEFENILETNYPGWKSEYNSEFENLRFKRKQQLEVLAEKGLSAAAYWLGIHLCSTHISVDLQTALGYERDKDMARRWLLIAALDDYPQADRKLKDYFDIDTKEVSTGEEMFRLGNHYSEDATEQGKDLRFFWLRKALDSGFEGACNNLGVCYAEGIGTVKDRKRAIDLYLRAIKHNDNEASYYNLGLNYFYGTGIEKNEEKAKKCLRIAQSKGFKSASSFLKDHFGVKDGIGLEFSDLVDEIVLFETDQLIIKFCGIQSTETGFDLRLWCENHSEGRYRLWLKNIMINGNQIEEFRIIGEISVEEKYKIVKFDQLLNAEDIMAFRVEIDDHRDNSLCETSTLRISISKSQIIPIFELLGPIIRIPLIIDVQDEFANKDFQNILLYKKLGLSVYFGGFKVLNGIVNIIIYTLNNSEQTYQLFFKGFTVNGVRVFRRHPFKISYPKYYLEKTDIPTKELDLDAYNDVEFSIIIIDSEREVVDITHSIKVHIDFPKQFINIEDDNSYTILDDTVNEEYAEKTSYSTYNLSIDPEIIASNITAEQLYELFGNSYEQELYDIPFTLYDVELRNTIRKAMKYI